MTQRRAWQFSEAQWLVIVAIGWLMMVGPGRIEGKYFPAAAPMTLSKAEAVQGAYATAIWGMSARLRPSCSFRRLEWYVGRRGGQDAPVMVTTGRAEVRPTGEFEFGPWTVELLPPERVADFSYADVLHQCHVFGVRLPWLTRTRFWN